MSEKILEAVIEANENDREVTLERWEIEELKQELEMGDVKEWTQ